MKNPLMAPSARRLALLLGLFLLAGLLSCTNSAEEDVVVQFNLDTTQLGQSDTLLFRIFNGKAPSFGSASDAEPVQEIRMPTPEGKTRVDLKLSDAVEEDFYIVAIGIDKDGKIIQTKLIAVEDGKVPEDAKPTLLVSSISAEDLVFAIGESGSARLTLVPPAAADKRVSLSSSNPQVVKVEGDSLKALAAGEATLKVTAVMGGATVTFKVEVKADIALDAISVDNLRGLVDSRVRVQPKFTPANATDRSFTLESKDTSIAVVSGDTLIARKLGRAEVVAAARSGGHKHTFTFSVESPRFDPDIKAITTSKCAPCHVPPAALDWGDSALFVRSGVDALRRITRPDGDKDKMPIASAPNGPLSTSELAMLVEWLQRVVVPVKGVTVSDMTVNLGDTVRPALVFDPADATNQEYTLVSQDSSLAPVHEAKRLVPEKVGQTTVSVRGLEGGRELTFKLTVKAPDFARNLRPIIQVKCFPCHTTGALNWVDSANFLNSGRAAMVRLQLPVGDTLRMPLAGAPNGDLTPHELRVLLGWLNSKVIPLRDFSVAADSMRVGTRKKPRITFVPANANNKAYSLTSLDTSVIEIEDDEMFAKDTGTIQVQLRALELDKVKAFTVKVLPMPVDSVRGLDTAGAVGDTVEPRIQFFPQNATNRNYTLTLVKATSTVIKVVGKKVVGLAVGSDSLRAVSADGNRVSAFKFTVGPVLPKSLDVPDTNGTSSGTDLVTPRLIWIPAATTNKAYTLSIPAADTNIAAVRGTQILGKTIGVVNAVTATSVADPTVKTTFKFTVGPVPVVGLTVSPTVAIVGATVSPVITWNPGNATTKTFSLSVLAPNTANLSVFGNNIIAKHLTTNGVVRVTSSSNTSAFANWSIQVIRPRFTGSAARAVFQNRCGECHVAGNAFGVANWLDSATVVGFRAGSTTVRNDTLILSRANPSLAPASRMPPSYAANPAALTAADYKALQDWLNAK